MRRSKITTIRMLPQPDYEEDDDEDGDDDDDDDGGVYEEELPMEPLPDYDADGAQFRLTDEDIRSKVAVSFPPKDYDHRGGNTVLDGFSDTPQYGFGYSRLNSKQSSETSSTSDGSAMYRSNISSTGSKRLKRVVLAVRVLKDWKAENDAELDVNKSEMLEVIEKRKVWWRCKNANGKTGWVPAKYLYDVTPE